MIKSFLNKDTERLWNRESVRRFQSFERVAYRKLIQLHRAKSLRDLKGPGLSLEELKKDRKGQMSVRITGKWRICFIWRDGHAERVEITDYH